MPEVEGFWSRRLEDLEAKKPRVSYIRYFSVTVVKYNGQGNLRVKSHYIGNSTILAYCSCGMTLRDDRAEAKQLNWEAASSNPKY